MAIRALDAVPVDHGAWVITALVVRPAVKRERSPDGGSWVEQPKVRNGVPGTEVECLVAIEGVAEPRTAKFTVYQRELPDDLPGQRIRLRGNVFAAPWASGQKVGLWFDVPDGVELASAPRPAKAS